MKKQRVALVFFASRGNVRAAGATKQPLKLKILTALARAAVNEPWCRTSWTKIEECPFADRWVPQEIGYRQGALPRRALQGVEYFLIS